MNEFTNFLKRCFIWGKKFIHESIIVNTRSQNEAKISLPQFL